MKYALMVALFFLSCSTKTKEHSVKNEKDEAYNVKVIQKNWDKKSFELLASSMLQQGDTISAFHIKIEFFDDTGSVYAVLTADSGKLNQKTGNMEAIGSVKVGTVRHDSLYTSKLIYIDSIARIESPRNVILVKKGRRIRGSGLISDVNLSNIQINGKVYGE